MRILVDRFRRIRAMIGHGEESICLFQTVGDHFHGGGNGSLEAAAPFSEGRRRDEIVRRVRPGMRHRPAIARQKTAGSSFARNGKPCPAQFDGASVNSHTGIHGHA